MKIDLKYSWLSALCFTYLALSPMAIKAQGTFVGNSISLDANERALLSEGFEKYTVFEFDQASFYQMIDQSREYAKFTLDIGPLYETIDLYENELRAPGYVAAQTGDDGFTELPAEEKCITFAGYVEGSSKDVRLNIQAHRFWGYVSTDEGQFYIEPLHRFFHDRGEGQYLLYNASDVIENDEIKCSAEEAETTIKKHSPPLGAPKTGDDCRKVEIATESAYELYDEGITFADIIGNLNLVESIYLSYFDLKFLVVYQHQWTTSSDPYNTSNSGCSGNGELQEFAFEWLNNFSNIRRDINVLYTEKDYAGSTIGCAWTGAFRDNADNDGFVFGDGTIQGAYCVNEWDWDDIFTFTSDAERRALVAHEMGHIFGAPHDESPSPGCGIMCASINVSTVFTSASQDSINLGLNHQSSQANDGRSAIRERFLPTISGDPIIELFSSTRSANVLNLDGALNQLGIFGSITTSYKATEKIKLLPGFNAVAVGGDKSTYKIGSCTPAEGLVENNPTQSEEFTTDQDILGNASAKVYPNPTSGQSFVEINIERETVASIRVLDALGRQVLVEVRGLVEGKNTLVLETEQFSQGLYFISITDQNGLNQTLKLQKID